MKVSKNDSYPSCWKCFVHWIRKLYQDKEDEIDFSFTPIKSLEVQMAGSNGTKYTVETYPDTGCDISSISLAFLKELGYSTSDIRPLRIASGLVSKL